MLIVAACCMARSVTLQLVGEQDLVGHEAGRGVWGVALCHQPSNWNIFCKVSNAKSPVSVFRREIIS